MQHDLKQAHKENAAGDAVALPEIISALSFALDLTEGAAPGHALRCCLLGMRIAAQVDLPQDLLLPLYYALQLKDVGCSNNASRVAQLVGSDDRAMKAATKITDWSRPLRTVRDLWPSVLPGRSAMARAVRLVRMGAEHKQNVREMTELRCERGADIVNKLSMGPATADAVRRLDELWDGSGYPGNLRGEQIPLLARICAVAQNLDCFAMAHGTDAAMEIVFKRSGTWFDPQLVRAAQGLHDGGTLWSYCRPECTPEVTRYAVMAQYPEQQCALSATHIDSIAEAFADVVDAKSPFTYRHSLGVAEVAEALAEVLGLTAERKRMVKRAALLHDLGKLGVPNTILDKRGPLTAQERAVVNEHPFLTRTILGRVTAFTELAEIAGQHHEKLDGSGYPFGVRADVLSLEARIIALADCFAALAETRPYREAMAVEDILAILQRESPMKLDGQCFEALRSLAPQWSTQLPASFRARPAEACALPVAGWQDPEWAHA